MRHRTRYRTGLRLVSFPSFQWSFVSSSALSLLGHAFRDFSQRGENEMRCYHRIHLFISDRINIISCHVNRPAVNNSRSANITNHLQAQAHLQPQFAQAQLRSSFSYKKDAGKVITSCSRLVSSHLITSHIKSYQEVVFVYAVKPSI